MNRELTGLQYHLANWRYYLSQLIPVHFDQTYQQYLGGCRMTWWQWRGRVWQVRSTPVG
jgi:hypothetical protein